MPLFLDIPTLRLTGFLMVSIFCLILLILWKKNKDIAGIKEGAVYSFLVSVEAAISIFPALRTHEIIVHLGNLFTILAYFALTLAIWKLCNASIKKKYVYPIIVLFVGISILAYAGVMPRQLRIWLSVAFIVATLGSAIYVLLMKNTFKRNIGTNFLLFWVMSHLVIFITRIGAALSLSGDVQLMVNSWTLLALLLSNMFIMLGLIIVLVFKRRNQLRNLLAEAEHSSQIKTVFLSNMTHEIRTPLNAIIGFSEMMDNQVLGKIENEKYAEYIQDIHRSSKYLLGLVDDILDVSAIDAGKRKLFIEEQSLSEISLFCNSLVQQSAQDKNIKVELDISESLPKIKVDRKAIMQAVINVLSNAIKYTNSGGLIIMNAEISGNFQVMKIIDNGIGISKESLEIIKAPFNRGYHNPHHTQQDGKGLGLSIANSLVELHGGRLDIESEVGTGTVISILLPT